MLVSGQVIIPSLVFSFSNTHFVEGKEFNSDIIEVIVTFIKLDVFTKVRSEITLYNLKYKIHKYKHVFTVNYFYSTTPEETPYEDGTRGIAIEVPLYSNIDIEYLPEEALIAKPKERRVILKPSSAQLKSLSESASDSDRKESKEKSKPPIKVFSVYTPI
ncbi:hypothetical protein PmNV_012 [Penaeus monodon nudivirus]|uniref:Uncharacterized protein n=1 Tax=Penaeus monodon nudivirus TaxID=1529056 RepID=A0A076FDR8_9VIRU|nr:hypothetical protein PmNV_012 [Penaeus monodon nudivirus]AII15800.1 hypothetical protein PmNV_012 [Penaeus monodon nudivirus]